MKSTGKSGDVLAPMTGVIKEIHVQTGKTVTAGEKVITMEAMKMDIAVNATIDGSIVDIVVETGSAVQQGDLLLKVSDA